MSTQRTETSATRPAMGWATTPDIDEVRPFSTEDEECFRELRDVLSRHKALDRFGIALIHKHFDISDDEQMMEFVDCDNRTLTIKPVKKNEVHNRPVTETNWRLTDGDKFVTSIWYCPNNAWGHTGTHRDE